MKPGLQLRDRKLLDQTESDIMREQQLYALFLNEGYLCRERR